MQYASMLPSVFSGLLSVMIAIPAMAQAPSPRRVDEVAKRGAAVMPFDLKQTQHIFVKTVTGGIQRVIVRNPTNTEQITVIRQHLAKISEEFRRGDFSDPAKLHGENMPGLAELRSTEPGGLRIDYRELTDGAEIIYSSDDPTLIAAIHRWFDAQLADHGPDAMPGHPHGAMHHPKPDLD